MKGNQILMLFSPVTLFLLLPQLGIYASDGGGNNSTKLTVPQGRSKPNKPNELAKPIKDDVFAGVKCTDTEEDEDVYSITRLGEDSCMLIKDEKNIPDNQKGNQSLGQACGKREEKM